MVDETPVKRRRIRELIAIFVSVTLFYGLWMTVHYYMQKNKPMFLEQPTDIMIKGNIVELSSDSIVKVEVVEHGILVDKESATLGVNGGVEKGVWSTTSVFIKGRPYVILRLTPQPAEKR